MGHTLQSVWMGWVVWRGVGAFACSSQYRFMMQLFPTPLSPIEIICRRAWMYFESTTYTLMGGVSIELGVSSRGVWANLYTHNLAWWNSILTTTTWAQAFGVLAHRFSKKTVGC